MTRVPRVKLNGNWHRGSLKRERKVGKKAVFLFKTVTELLQNGKMEGVTQMARVSNRTLEGGKVFS
jgi:hypothetical protein